MLSNLKAKQFKWINFSAINLNEKYHSTHILARDVFSIAFTNNTTEASMIEMLDVQVVRKLYSFDCVNKGMQYLY